MDRSCGELDAAAPRRGGWPRSRAVARLLRAARCSPSCWRRRRSLRGEGEDDPVDVQVLAFNDFHGRLQPPAGSDGRIGSIEAGGIEYLTSHLARLKASNPNTVVVSAGDNIGASPLLSGMFHDEPTIEALDAAGLELSAVGNHELDEGWAELYRMQNGGCHPVDGCQDGTRVRRRGLPVSLGEHRGRPAPRRSRGHWLPAAGLPGRIVRRRSFPVCGQRRRRREAGLHRSDAAAGAGPRAGDRHQGADLQC